MLYQPQSLSIREFMFLDQDLNRAVLTTNKLTTLPSSGSGDAHGGWRTRGEECQTHVKAFQVRSPWLDVPGFTHWFCNLASPADWEWFLMRVRALGYKVAAISGSRAIFQAVKAYEAGGTFDAEIEVVPRSPRRAANALRCA
jgi:hypothetical protein